MLLYVHISHFEYFIFIDFYFHFRFPSMKVSRHKLNQNQKLCIINIDRSKLLYSSTVVEEFFYGMSSFYDFQNRSITQN